MKDRRSKQYLILLGLFAAVALSGCATSHTMLGEMDEYGDFWVSATGLGVAPPDVEGPDHARVLAKRAAEADAYRQLAEKIAGLDLVAKYSTSKNAIDEDIVRIRVSAYLSAAEIEQVAYIGNRAEVEMKINLSHISSRVLRRTGRW